MKNQPTLAPPGAGLPKWRLFFMRPFFRFASSRVPVGKFLALYDNERARILELTATLEDNKKSQQVLVPPMTGIEDSSRFWSVFMTLQHLHIVEVGVSGIIAGLSEEEPVETLVRIEDVKPSQEADSRDEKRFSAVSQKTAKMLESHAPFASATTHLHPWFGELTARQWFALRAVHLRIHRRQIEKIIAGLS